MLATPAAQALASDIWSATICEMQSAGTLAAVNAEQIERYVVSCVMYARAVREVDTNGPILANKRTRTGTKNPYWSVLKDADTIATGHEADLGLNPRRRGQVAAAKRTKKATGADAYLATTR